MNPYILAIMADILYAANFATQKLYQQKAGTAMKAGLWFNGLVGFFSVIMYLIINGFKLHISAYSVFSAMTYSISVMSYVLLGFKVMEKGNVSLYTLFLMSGGMLVPYVYGILFLNEELTVLRTLGLLVIVAALVVSNSGNSKPDKKQLLFCVGIFIFNGITSTVTKVHQIHPVSEYVTSVDYSILGKTSDVILCVLVGFLLRKKLCSSDQPKVKIKSLWPITAISAVVCGLGFLCQLSGSKELPATVLFPLITGGSVIFSAFAGMLGFREKPSVRQWMGIAGCFVGTLFFL